MFSQISECVLMLTELNFKKLKWEGSVALREAGNWYMWKWI